MKYGIMNIYAALILLWSMFCLCHPVFADEKGDKDDRKMGNLSGRYESDGKGGLSLLSRKDKSGKKLPDKVPFFVEVLKSLDDATVFVQIGDDDCLTWGALHSFVDQQFKTKVNVLLGSAGTAADDVKLGLYQQGISRLSQQYIRAAVIAWAAKKEGIVVEPSEFEEEIRKLKAKSPELSVFQSQYMTNAVYQRAYAERYLKAKIKVEEADVKRLIKQRHELNLSVPATNNLLRLQMEGIRAKLANNEISFGEAADVYSECPQCSAENGDCGTWEEDDSEIATNLLKVCFSLPTNVVSEVVETPDAFHVVKIVSKYVPTKKARDEDGEVSSVDVRHVQIDKWQEEPELTPEVARKNLSERMLKSMLRAKQQELIATIPIKSVIPLKSDGKSKGMRRLKSAH